MKSRRVALAWRRMYPHFRIGAGGLSRRRSTTTDAYNLVISSPKMAEVSRRPSPRTNKPSSIHTPLSLALRADAALHSIVLFKRRNHPRSNPTPPCMLTLTGLVLARALERELLHSTLFL
jgi:hypothetical protein